MSTASKPRKRVKPERHVILGTPTNGVFALHMTIGTGDKAQHFGYYVQPIPADFGLGFRFEKFDAEKIEGEPFEYDVNIDLQRGYHSCTCKGNTYCGHCKHVESILALIQSGKIDAAATKPEAPKPATPDAVAEGHGEQFASLMEWEQKLILRTAKSEREIRAMASNFIAQRETPFEDL